MNREDKALRGAHAKAPAAVAFEEAPKAAVSGTATSEVVGASSEPVTPEVSAPLAPLTPEPKRLPSPIKIALVAACALVLVGAGVAAAYAGLFGEKKPAIPETVQATVKADGVFIPGATLQRGDALENVVEADELTGVYAGAYYRAAVNGQTVYVAKRFVRTSAEAAPEQWTGYAAADAIMFANSDLSMTEFLTLSLNEQVEVLDEFNGLLFVRNADGAEGYMPVGKILREPAPDPQEAASSSSSSKGSSGSYKGNSSSGSSGSSGGSSGGSSAGSGSSDGSSGGSSGGGATTSPSTGGGSDGEEVGLPAMPMSAVSYARSNPFGVQLAYAAQPGSAEAEGEQGGSQRDAAQADGSEADAGLSGVILADGTQSYLGLLNRGDAVTVKVDDMFGFADRTLAEDADEGLKAIFVGEGEADVEGRTEGSADEGDAAGESASVAADAAESDSAFPQNVPLSEEEQDLLAASEDLCTVIINGQETTLPEKLLRLEGEVDYAAWSGFAAEGTVLYSDYLLTAAASSLEVNAPLQVIDAIGSSLVVQTESDVLYVAEASASKEQIEIVEPEEPTEAVSSSSGSSSNKGGPSYRPSSGASGSSGGSGSSSGPSSGNSSSGGGSGSGSDAGSGGTSGGGTSSTDNTPEWSAPVL